MNPGRTPYPNIGAAAWTVLLRVEEGRPISVETAASLVGSLLAADAIADLTAKHLVEDCRFTPLANTMRRWHRPKVQR